MNFFGGTRINPLQYGRNPGSDVVGGTGVNPLPAYPDPGGGTVNPQNFVDPSWSAPFLDRIGLGTSIAGFGAASLPNAAAFQQNLFNPGFSPMENAFMDNESARQARALGPSMARNEAQYGSTPFHSGALNMFRDMGEGLGLNLGNQALQLGLNRQNQATGQLGRILGSPLDAAAQAQGGVTDMANFTQNLMNSAFQIPMGIASQAPLISPSVIASPGGGGGKFG